MLTRAAGRLSMMLRSSSSFSAGYFSHKPTAYNNDNTPFEFTEDNYGEVQRILSKYPEKHKRSAIIPLLMLAQKQNDNFLSLNAMRKVAKIVEVNEMDIYEVASFYTMFNREKVGKFHLQICGTTPCMLRGAEDIIKTCQKHLGIKKNHTTADGLFTIQEVECLGACANAPMIQINGQWVYEDLTPENTVKLLQDLKAGREKKGPQIDRNHAEGPQGRTCLHEQKNEKEVRHDRDFAQAKKQWEEAENKRIQEQKRKAEEAKKLEEEKRKMQAKKP